MNAGASLHELTVFLGLFPAGCPIDTKHLVRAVDNGLDVLWMLRAVNHNLTGIIRSKRMGVCVHFELGQLHRDPDMGPAVSTPIYVGYFRDGELVTEEGYGFASANGRQTPRIFDRKTDELW